MDNDGSYTNFTSGTAGPFDFNKDGTIDFRLRQRNNSSSYLSGNAARIAASNAGNLRVIGKAFSTAVLYPSRLAANALIGPAATFGTLTNGASGFMAGGLSGLPA